MKSYVPRLFAAPLLAVIVTIAPVVHAQQSSAESNRIDRLVALAKVWTAVKFFHPYLAYRSDVDWDEALVQTIPKVNAAHDGKEYSAAIEFMLEKLNDPVTRVLDTSTKSAENPASSAEQQPTFRTNSDGILVVSMTRYTDFADFVGSRQRLQMLKEKLPSARAVVFDLRPETPPSDFDEGNVSYAFATSGIAENLATVSLDVPGERRRKYLGYAPQHGSTSGGYSSGFYLEGRPLIKPGMKAIPLPSFFSLVKIRICRASPWVFRRPAKEQLFLKERSAMKLPSPSRRSIFPTVSRPRFALENWSIMMAPVVSSRI
jgi:hypothetical protein